MATLCLQQICFLVSEAIRIIALAARQCKYSRPSIDSITHGCIVYHLGGCLVSIAADCDVLCSFGPFFVSPVIAGLDDKDNEPFICGMDTIGAIETAKDFMVAGTAPDSLYGMCESMWQPDMVSCQHCISSLLSHRYRWRLLVLPIICCSAMCVSLWRPHMVFELPERAHVPGAYSHATHRLAGVHSMSSESLK